jgi:3-hydroxyacyl-CoA dehydrogenase
MVIECIPEIKSAKIDLLGQLDRLCADDTITATISSSCRSNDLLGKVSESGRVRVLNTHNFQSLDLPPAELRFCGYTDPAIIDLLVPKPRDIGLGPVIAKRQSTGLVYNPVWAAMKREVMIVLADEAVSGLQFRLAISAGQQFRPKPCYNSVRGSGS